MTRITEKFWEDCRYFLKGETWGDWTKISKELIDALIRLRQLANRSVNIHCAWASGVGHSSKSMHYTDPCLAADVHITGMTILEQVKLAHSAGFNAIGAYPFWNKPGIHVDLRGLLGKPDIFWIEAEKGKEGTYTYYKTFEEFCEALKQIKI